MQRTLAHDMIRFDGIATRSQLRGLGYSQRGILIAIEAGEIQTVGRRWLVQNGASRPSVPSVPSAPSAPSTKSEPPVPPVPSAPSRPSVSSAPPVSSAQSRLSRQSVRAVELGGRLAAAPALASYGVWVTHASGLWVASPQTSSRLPPVRAGEHRLWWREQWPVTDDRLWRMSLRDSLAQFARIGRADDVIASCDSALNKSLVTPDELAEVFRRLPRRMRRLLALVDGKAESGLESLLRLAALAEGWNVEIQVRIAGVGRVDLVIDGWLVIEADGAQWHDDDVSRDEDSRREADLILLGYRWHRFRYYQVLDQMPRCIDVIRTILASGRPTMLVKSGAAAAGRSQNRTLRASGVEYRTDRAL